MPRTEGRSAAPAWLKRPGLAPFALAFLAGNLLLHQSPALPAAGFVLLGTLGGLAAIARCGVRGASLPAVLVLGICWTAQAAERGLAARWPAALDGRDIELSGWIDSEPGRDAGRTVLTLRVVAAATDIPLRRVRLSWYEPAPALAAGQTLTVVARLRAPRGLVNPGGFDYERWLYLDGLDATGYVRSGAVVDDAQLRPARAWLRLRMGLAARIDRLVADADAAALLTALGLGERGGFTDQHWRVLQRTGTSHLVAVSGLHVGLIAAMAFVVLRLICLRLPYRIARHAHAVAALGSFVPAVLYAALAGFALPTQRALVMLAVAELVLVARRRVPLSSGLALALIAVVLFDPLATLSASFWLSFGAVALLLSAALGTAPATGSGAGFMPALTGYVRLQWALTLGLAPLVVWYFGQLSLASFFVNLIAIPVFSLAAVPLALLLIVAIALDTGAALLALPAGAVAGLAWQGLAMAAAHPYAALSLPQASAGVALLAVLGVAMAVPPHGLPGRRLALAGLVPLLAGTGDRVPDGEFRLTVLDVGQGLAALIETSGHRLLYDAGPVYQSGFDAGAEIVAPAVTALGTAPLDLLIVGHGDADHAGGAPALIARFPDMRVIGGPDVADLADAPCVAGSGWTFDDIRFEILHPVSGFRPVGNETSCVLRVSGSSGSLLVTGDIERLAENRLLREADLAADVVLVPHHGSLTSSSTAFVEAVGARFAIVSAGFNNRWGFPRPEVVERWQSAQAQVLVTGDAGAVTVGFAEDGIRVSLARDRRQRYWHPKPEPVSGAGGLSAL